MLRLPLMVAAGGINSAGRTSRRHAYRRMIWDHLSAADRAATESALSQMMDSADTEENNNCLYAFRISAGQDTSHATVI